EENSAGHSIGCGKFFEETLNLHGILPDGIMLEHIGTKVDVATEDLVRSFACINHFESRIANRAAQEKLGNAMAIPKDRFGMKNGVGQMIRNIRLLDRYRMK